MAVPTFASITPTVGSPTGGALVEVLGTGFRLPTPAGPEIPAPKAPPSVRVTIGGTVVSPWVVSATRLLFPLPKRALPVHATTGATLGEVVVDVLVENIDDDGVLIPGEFVLSASAFTYRRPSVGYDNIGAVTKTTAALIDLLRSEVLANTVHDTDPDYDPDTATSVIEVQATPQLVLTGPDLTFNAFFTNRGASLNTVGLEGRRARRPRVVDLGFEIICVTNSTVELLNLMELIEWVVDRNPTLTVTLPMGDLALELHWAGDPQYERQPSDGSASGLRVARGSVQLRGLPLTGDADAIQEVGYELDEVVLAATTQIGENLPATHGAPTRSPGDAPLPGLSTRPHGAPTRSPPDGVQQ